MSICQGCFERGECSRMEDLCFCGVCCIEDGLLGDNRGDKRPDVFSGPDSESDPEEI